MLSREEYNATFDTNLSQEDFEELDPMTDLRDAERITFVDAKTLEKYTFVSIKEGVWEKVQEMRFPLYGDLFKCPFCHSTQSSHVNGVDSAYNWHYCPNCGARLKYTWERKEGTE